MPPMPNTTAWDRVPVHAWFYNALQMPDTGKIVRVSIEGAPGGVKRVDGTAIYRAGTAFDVKVGPTGQDTVAVGKLRDAYRAQAVDAAAAAGTVFDSTAWDAWWTERLPALLCLTFPATDDPEVTPHGWQVKIEERVDGGATYYLDLPLALLDRPIPGVNLASVAVPAGTPTAPAPTYAKGQPGGVAALDADGDVLNARGDKVTGGAASFPAGTDGHVLTLVNGQPTWASMAGGGAAYDDTEVRGLINDEAQLRAGADAALADRLIALEDAPAATPYDDTALAGRVTALEDEPDPTPYDDTQVRQLVTDEAETRANADTALDGRVTALEQVPPGQAYDDTALTQRVAAEEQARAEADDVLAGRLTTLEEAPDPTPYDDGPLTARVAALEEAPDPTPYDDTTLTQRVAAEEQARADGDNALGTRVTALEDAPAPTPYDDTQVRQLITDEADARTAADTALDGRVTTLEEAPEPTPYDDTDVRALITAEGQAREAAVTALTPPAWDTRVRVVDEGASLAGIPDDVLVVVVETAG